MNLVMYVINLFTTVNRGNNKFYSHCVKSVRIQNFSSPYFPAFGLNTERYLSVFNPNAETYGLEKPLIRTLFYTVSLSKCFTLSQNIFMIKNETL